ncbi:DUF4198 domain-containing protein [Catenovulum sp. 2E275]|uniref:DUF4198 domain-containing protein n=1 Tax=Catenovulum sp. 2E275 TaxID=2980497 RepID=UPI0021D184BD|nr:DUF4198 domain-containing protein [Catenovulum sp. 2E275]MCU4676526.1 DUF4198 domain-containing protein [Catenovulum sp. 2E275]
MKNKMIKSLVAASLAVGLLQSNIANAHRVWIKPSTTVVSGESEWVTFDAAVANVIFFADHFPLGLNYLKALSPSGKEVELQNAAKLKYRSVFDLELTEQGTYQVFGASQSLTASWKDDEGKRQRWPGRGEVGTIEGFNKSVPKNATDLKVVESSRRIEVFVTLGEPSTIKSTGKGIELNAKTHPTDLYVGEAAQFQFVLDGKPISGGDIVIVKDGEKYRNDSKALKIKTDDKGNFEVNFKEAGLYWLELEYSDDKAAAPAQERSASYSAVFEVQAI